ncbi:hypothetical protein STEG23_030240 [Scotinomys teguina]
MGSGCSWVPGGDWGISQVDIGSISHTHTLKTIPLFIFCKVHCIWFYVEVFDSLELNFVQGQWKYPSSRNHKALDVQKSTAERKYLLVPIYIGVQVFHSKEHVFPTSEFSRRKMGAPQQLYQSEIMPWYSSSYYTYSQNLIKSYPYPLRLDAESTVNTTET